MGTKTKATKTKTKAKAKPTLDANDVTASALLEAIRNDPSDDAARAVYADRLIEKGDPRGEFIAMQLQRSGRAPTPAAQKRELTILRKHVRRWLGELVPVIPSFSVRLAVGPREDDDPLASHCVRFDRGFLAGCPISGTDRRVTSVIGHPSLATLEELAIGEKYYGGPYKGPFLAHPVLRNVTRLTTMPGRAALVSEASFAKTLQTLTLLNEGEGDVDLVGVIRSAAKTGLPALRELHFECWGPMQPNVDAIAIGLTMIPSLEQLTCALNDKVGATFTATKARKWKVLFNRGAGHAQAAQLRALCRR